VDKFDGSDEKLLIDAAEDSFSKLMLKTQQIYSETLSRKLESLETKEFIESKRENTSGKE
jgi:DNA-binding HxlR family transcriptional regulator